MAHLSTAAISRSSQKDFVLAPKIGRQSPASRHHVQHGDRADHVALRDESVQCGPPSDVCWFINPSKYSYKYHKL